jgi:hypothetical protein
MGVPWATTVEDGTNDTDDRTNSQQGKEADQPWRRGQSTQDVPEGLQEDIRRFEIGRPVDPEARVTCT